MILKTGIFLLIFLRIYRLHWSPTLPTDRMLAVKADPWHCHILSY